LPVNGDLVDHHGSHRALLDKAADIPPAPHRIDAIFVPTARPVAYLTEAAQLSVALDCPLVTLHSGRWTSAREAYQRLPVRMHQGNLDLIAIDLSHTDRLRLPRWQTSSMLEGTLFARRTDQSAKRNLGFMLARMLGWSRILFLDDDITELSSSDMRRASGLLNIHQAVGLHVGGFPDHSVVCHAYRQSGGEQQAFIGGGALAVAASRSTSFFPDIYNEDWFYLLDADGKGLQSVTATGQVRQYPYDPFRSPDRARSEEFGDVLAEGIYWLLDQGQAIADAGQEHWSAFLEKRGKFIKRVIDMVEVNGFESGEKRRIKEALRGSLGRLARITPELCETYLRAWAADRRSWQSHVERLPSGRTREQAVHWLTRGTKPWLTRGDQSSQTVSHEKVLVKWRALAQTNSSHGPRDID
jgi:hypothetical protein